jgi:hypothetical protein
MDRPGTGASNLVNALLVIALFLLGIVLVSSLCFESPSDGWSAFAHNPCQLDISSSIESKLEQLNRLSPSPITRVSFHDALQTQALTTAVDQYYGSAIAILMSGDGLNAVIQSIAITGDKLKLVYSFSDEAIRLYDSGQAMIPVHQASGRRLPSMTGRNGVIIEQAKEANIAEIRIAQATALILSAAHIISGLDVVRRLEAVDRRLSTLVAGGSLPGGIQRNDASLLGQSVPEEYQFCTDPRNQMRNRSDAFQKKLPKKQALALCEGIDGYVAILEAICGDGNTDDLETALATSVLIPRTNR